MIIVDDFLPPSFHNDLVSLVTNKEFPWYYNDSVTYETEGTTDAYFFSHAALMSTSAFESLGVNEAAGVNYVSDKFEAIRPMLYFMEDKANFRLTGLLRAQFNMFTNMGRTIKGAWHIDQEIEHYVGLYYINTTNGPTDFIDGSSVECVANRLVLFDGKALKHRSTHSTDTKYRANINFNMQGYFI
jgi:hypothetical protein